MLIVGWIKNWNMRTLLDILDEKTKEEVTQERLDKINKKYPFMTNNIHVYVSNRGVGMDVKPYVAHLSKKLTDALWDTKDDLKKLGFHTYIQSLKFDKLNKLKRFNEKDLKEFRQDKKDYRETYAGYVQSREAYKLQRKTNWFQVK